MFTTPAKVLAKTIELYGENVRTHYYMSFELPDGKRWYFDVGLAAYITLLEGESGTLKYEERTSLLGKSSWHFQGFTRD